MLCRISQKLPNPFSSTNLPRFSPTLSLRLRMLAPGLTGPSNQPDDQVEVVALSNSTLQAFVVTGVGNYSHINAAHRSSSKELLTAPFPLRSSLNRDLELRRVVIAERFGRTKQLHISLGDADLWLRGCKHLVAGDELVGCAKGTDNAG